MALPFEGDSTRNRGVYDVSMDPDEIRSIRMKERDPDGASASLPVFSQDEQYTESGNGCWAYFVDLCDRFRDALAHSCCACAMSMPSVLLLLLFIIIILGLLTAVPLFFAMAYTGPSAQKSEDYTNIGNAEGGLWPEDTKPVEFNIELMNTSRLLPKDVDACRGFGFVCTANPNIVVGTNQRCDGFADCPDGSDEFGCFECMTAFSCPNHDGNSSQKLCLRGSDLCDGQAHCFDRSDESAFCTPHCQPDQYQCPDEKMCLPKSYLCDGDSHCRSEADEKDCNGTCNNGAKWCSATRACIPKWKLCDGINDCPDGSDEAGCDCKACSGTSKALCKKEGICISRNHVCNGVPDCPGGSDEEDCPGNCAPAKSDDPDFIKCKDGKLYSKMYACGGLVAACDGLCEECNKDLAFDCGDKKCIARRKVCDGRQDCPNNSDEKNCSCGVNTFRCKAKSLFSGVEKCIPISAICDGYRDCFDGEDEKNCLECKGDETFRCVKENTCLPAVAVCNGIEECADGSDEAKCDCDTCQKHPYDMYMCEKGHRCFRKHQVCDPYSRCPNSKVDKLYCAAKQRPFFMF
uniref:Low-density lipoprotein receptor domain class A n=1 Tax=Panagrellus redivivus TaxID=6233 RepID=A0A7E4VGX0_PANRE